MYEKDGTNSESPPSCLKNIGNGLRSDIRASQRDANFNAELQSCGTLESRAGSVGRVNPDMFPLIKLSHDDIDAVAKTVPDGQSNIQDIYPLSPLQEGLLFHHLLNRERDPYVLSTLIEIESKDKLDALIRALNSVIERHDSLRIAIVWSHVAQPVQVVYRHVQVHAETLEVPIGSDPLSALSQKLHLMPKVWNLEHAPLAKLIVAYDGTAGKWYALLQFHHVICDFASMRAVISEIGWYLAGRWRELSVPMAYRLHIQKVLANLKTVEAEEFFRSKLGDVTEPTVAFGLVNVHGEGNLIEESHHFIDPTWGFSIRQQSERLNLPPSRLFHALWALVLSHISSKRDVVFGTVILADWQRDPARPLILGMSINTLPLRISIGSATAIELVGNTQRELAELLRFEQTPLVLAQRSSGVSPSMPLFGTLLNYRRSASPANLDWKGIDGFRVLATPEAKTNYPIVLTVDDLGDGFKLTAQTDGRVSPRRLIGYVLTGLESLTNALDAAPDTPATALRVMPESERQEVLYDFNPTANRDGSSNLVHLLFEEQVRRTPNATALVHGGKSLTYIELNAQANQLARYLRNLGVGPKKAVAICIGRSVEMVISVLGALKAGGAYVPLDPTYPVNRLKYMLDEAAPIAVLVDTELSSVLPETSSICVGIKEKLREIAWNVAENLSPVELELEGGNLVYIIYTSGSTGRPKGVEMTHTSLSNLIDWHRGVFCTGSRVLQFAPLSFDVAFQEIFTTLCTGSTLVLLDEWVRRDVRALSELFRDQCIERVFLPPLMLQSLAENLGNAHALLESLRDIVTAGEQLRISAEVRALFRGLNGCRLHNHYGPTETHVVTALTLDGDPDAWPTLPRIGHPISNARLYVVDRDLQPTPIGVPGEICIGGIAVARGYLDNKDETAKRFVGDSWSGEADARMYRTGDLGTWHPDGILEFLGRNDAQVKIRGYRIEPGEVEAELSRQPDVREVVVVARGNTTNDRRLVAYVTGRGDSELDPGDLRERLRSTLPDFMVPAAIVVLDALPTTASGKIDRKALPSPKSIVDEARRYDPPRNEVETIVAGIWQELLKVERIGRDDNFFELGGHSILVMQMLERLRRAGFLTDVRRAFDTHSLAELANALIYGSDDRTQVPPNRIPKMCEAITPEMVPLIKLTRSHIEWIEASVQGGATNIQDIYPLSTVQEGILFHHLLGPSGVDIYARPMLLSFATPEKLRRFICALQSVVDRHDILRSSLLWERLPQPVQVVMRSVQLRVEVLPFDGTDGSDALRRLKERMEPHQCKLNLHVAPLLRLETMEDRNSGRCYALLKTHHLVCDNVSLNILLSEVKSLMADQRAILPKPIPFRQHVAHQILSANRADDEIFFREKLSDIDEPTAPFGLLNVQGDGIKIREAQHRLEAELSIRIRERSRFLKVSCATLFHAVWALVVARTSGRDDVVYGTVLLGRMLESTSVTNSLGIFINTLPLRLRLQRLTALELVQQTQRELVSLLSHEQASLVAVQRCSGISGTAPLFTALLNYRRNSSVDAAESILEDGVALLASRGYTNYPLVLSVDDTDNSFVVSIEVDSSVDARRLVDYVCTAMESLLDALQDTPRSMALDLQISPESERRELVEGFNRDVMDNPDKLIHELVEEQVKRKPNAPAVTFEGVCITYGQLNDRANELAELLRENGIGPDKLVGICADRSLEMVVGLFAILKAGGAYVPFDPTYPSERLNYMLQDAEPDVLLAQVHLIDRLPKSNATVVPLQSNSRARPLHSSHEPVQIVRDLSNLAYVIYTSGSTGRPKGAMNEHRGVVNRLQWMQKAYRLQTDDRVLQKTPFSFDVSVWEFFWTLTCGAHLIVARPEGHKDPAYIREIVETAKITTLHFVPSMLQTFIDHCKAGQCPTLKHIVCSGEELSASLQASCLERLPHVRLSNLYGPTEAAVDVTYWECCDADSRVPIGRPISNIQMYVLDSSHRLCPLGVSGGLFIAGIGVGRGYHKRPELTAEKFVPNPFSKDGGARMYRTGDLARWRPDGALEYLGRDDYQVKIRGFRIELGEIEAQLTRHAGIKEAVVLVNEGPLKERRLIAYVVPSGPEVLESQINDGALRTYLRFSLPDYMIPSAVMIVDAFSVTPNGKLDRRSLPNPRFGMSNGDSYVPPVGELERIVCDIWMELLGVERIGRRENFFALGGHSLLATRVASRVSECLDVNLSVRDVFYAPTVQGLAEFLAEKGDSLGFDSLDPAPRHESDLDEMQEDDLLKEISNLRDRLGGNASKVHFAPSVGKEET